MISCQTTKQVSPKTEFDFSSFEFKQQSMDATVGIDSSVYFFIKPYADSIRAQMSLTLGTSKSELVRSKPESSLGNIVAEALRDRASLLLKTNVDIGLVNLGGLRTNLSAGEITVGTIFELMPFENKMSILKVTGDQLQSILNEIAALNGEPLSGVRFQIKKGVARDVIVSGQPIDSNQIYTLATSDYLVNGGGQIPSLKYYQERTDTNFLIRDIIIDYVKNRRILNSVLDGRVRS